MQTKQKGDIAVSAAIFFFTNQGYEILLPIGDKKPYDMVVEKDGKLFKVQVKYAGIWRDDGKCYASLRVMGGNQSFYTAKRYGVDSFDYLFVYSSKNQAYLFPWRELRHPRSTLSVEAPMYSKYKLSLQG